MKYFSDVTNKVYETVEALQEAEKSVLEERQAKELAAQKKKEEREVRAKEVDAAIKAAVDAQKIATDKLNAFCKDYGTFHTTVANANALLGNVNPFDNFFRTFWGF